MNPDCKILGHGGMGIAHTLPINTFESILKCLNMGAEGVEIDIQLSKDSVWIIFHDSDMSPATNLSGSIFNNNWQQIKGAYYMNPLYAQYPVIHADELFHSIVNKENYIFSLDLKNYQMNPDSNYTDLLALKYTEWVIKQDIVFNSYLTSSDLNLLMKVKSLNPDIETFIYSSDFQKSKQEALVQNFEGISIHINSLNQDLVKEAHQSGLKIAAFGINSGQSNIDAIEYGVDYIETDQLQHILQITNN